jgi:hypothetical protein
VSVSKPYELFRVKVLQLIWFFTILRVAYRVITGRGAEDARSDDEEYVCFMFPSFQPHAHQSYH